MFVARPSSACSFADMPEDADENGQTCMDGSGVTGHPTFSSKRKLERSRDLLRSR